MSHPTLSARPNVNAEGAIETTRAPARLPITTESSVDPESTRTISSGLRLVADAAVDNWTFLEGPDEQVVDFFHAHLSVVADQQPIPRYSA